MGHFRLVSVVGEESILQDKPSLLVALDVVGPLEQPSLVSIHVRIKCNTSLSLSRHKIEQITKEMGIN